MKLARHEWFFYPAALTVFFVSFNAGVGFLALKRLEKRVGSPIHGTFLPDLFRPTFTLKNPSFDWQGRFQVFPAGSLQVSYNPFFLIPGSKLRTRIRGRDLVAHLSGEWVESQGISKVRIDRLEADFAWPKKGPPEIFLFQIQSPELRLDLTRKKNGEK